MSSLDELMSQIPIGDVAARLGVDEQTARAAVEQALPALVSGMEANAKDPGGAASLEKAVSKHSPALVEGGVNLDEVDTNDGEKIVSHVFGSNKDQVVQTLSSQPAGFSGGGVVGKLLPILAPIVLSYLAKKFQERKQPTETVQPTEPMQPKQPAKEPEGGLGGLLGGLLGGGSGSGSSGGGIGDIPGGLLGGGGGGGSKGGNSGGIGDLLGGLLGGGRK
jgi:hypothetical protein